MYEIRFQVNYYRGIGCTRFLNTCNCGPFTLSRHNHKSFIYIRESVDSLCRDGADVQYMQ